MTGAPMPTDAMSRMQMAPDVYNFTKSFAKKPNLFEKTGNLVKNIGRGAVMALGAPLVAASVAEEARMQEQLRNQGDIAESEAATTSDPVQASEELEVEKEKTKRKTIEMEGRKDLVRMANTGVQQTNLNPVQMDDYQSLLNPTTADKYGQPFVANQTSSNIIDRKISQGSQIADDTPNVAEVLSESQDSNPVDFVDAEKVQQQMEAEMVGKSMGKRQLSKFMGRENLDKALLGAFTQRKIQEEMFGEALSADSNLLDHPDLPGGEDDIGLPSVTNTSPTTNLQEQTGGGKSLNKRYIDHADEMRRMEAQERRKRKSPSEEQINLLEQRAIDNKEAIDSGFMSMSDEERANETARLGGDRLSAMSEKSPDAISETDLKRTGLLSGQLTRFPAGEETRKAEERKRLRRERNANMPTSEKVDDFMAKFVEGAKSDIVRGARGNKSLGITRIPATNGDAQVGFVLANKPVDQSPMYATTYGFGVAPGAESLLDNQLNRDTFSDYMKRGMKEAKQGKQRQAGEIFEYLIPQQRIITGDARLGDIVM
tara:strand:+ start:26 stop:1651 length:1626 start_codon:yes stop_codon:yes gene_type:complete